MSGDCLCKWLAYKLLMNLGEHAFRNMGWRVLPVENIRCNFAKKIRLCLKKEQGEILCTVFC